MPEEREAARRAHNQNQSRAFDAVAHVFDQPIPEDILQRLDAVVDAANIRPGESVLDAGIGAGVLVPLIQRRSPGRIYGCDLSAGMLRATRERFGEQVTLARSDVQDAPREWLPLDVVFCNAMFGNVYSQVDTVSAIARMLAPGGRLLISHPMGKAFVQRLKESTPEYQLTELPEEESLREMLTGTGLTLTHYLDMPDLYLAVCTLDA